MAYAQVVIPGDGVTTLVAVDFVLGVDPSVVTCRVGNEQDGIGAPVYRTFTFVQPGWAQVQGAPAKVGENYIFQRVAEKDKLVVDWEDGNPITKENLNKAQLHGLHYSHELDDRIAGIEVQDFSTQIKTEQTARLAGDAALSARLDGYLVVIGQETDRAERAADQSGVFASESADHAAISHALVEAAVAGFQGFNDGMAYDYGWARDEMTYFNRDFGLARDTV